MNVLAVGLLVLGCVGCRTADPAQFRSGLISPLRPFVEQVAKDLDKVPAERRPMLEDIAATIVRQLESGKEANLTFICTHNSRRSHMSQIWAQTAAYYYQVPHVNAYSGGTETTACNCRTVTAMRHAGFTITDVTKGENPVYLVKYATDRRPIRAYSKPYNGPGNPKEDFIALMTCSVADRSCPKVDGAIARYAIHYADPRVCDDTPNETAAYNERCQEIAREMFYIMARTRDRLAQKETVPAATRRAGAE